MAITIDQIRQEIKDFFTRNFQSGVPKIPPHYHTGVDNPQIPIGNTTGNLPASRISNLPTATPGGMNGDLQINASGVFGTIGGLNLDQTGNTRGSFALDLQTKRSAVTKVASGNNSVAIGKNNTASGTYSTAAGYSNTASNTYSSVFGGYNISSGLQTGSVGYNNTASGDYSFAAGNSNKAQGHDDLAIGFGNTTSSYGSSIAIGISNTVQASVSGLAMGINVTNGTNGTMQFGLNNTFKLIWNSVGNLGLNGQSFGSGKPVIFIANATTAPSTNPTGGGILYVTAGALTYRGSSGTVTPIAPA